MRRSMTISIITNSMAVTCRAGGEKVVVNAQQEGVSVLSHLVSVLDHLR